MNGNSSVRRVVATLTIGSFSIAALMGIVALLSGGEFGEGEAKVLLTTLIVGSASICMLCYLATADTRWARVGLVGSVVLVVPVATALMLVWQEWGGEPEGLLKTFGIGVVAAITIAQICLLLSLAGARPGLRLILVATVVLAVVLAGLVSGLILEAFDGDSNWRLLGVVAILDVLGTLVTIALAKFGGKDGGGAGGPAQLRLSAEQSGRIIELARSSGRDPGDLVAEAVERYLRGPDDRA